MIEIIQGTKENLRVGCHHEIGHTLAAFLVYPQDDFICSICFQRTRNGGYVFNTEINGKYFEESKSKIKEYAFFALAGGVFQQMMHFYNQFSGNKQDLYQFLCKNVKSHIDGMEKDMEMLNDALSEYKANGNYFCLDYDDIKNDIIYKLLPRVGDKNVEDFCDHMIKTILEDTKYGWSSTFDIDTIYSYLCFNPYR